MTAANCTRLVRRPGSGPMLWIRMLRAVLWLLVAAGPVAAGLLAVEVSGLRHRVDVVSRQAASELPSDTAGAEGFAELYVAVYLGGDEGDPLGFLDARSLRVMEQGSWPAVFFFLRGEIFWLRGVSPGPGRFFDRMDKRIGQSRASSIYKRSRQRAWGIGMERNIGSLLLPCERTTKNEKGKNMDEAINEQVEPTCPTCMTIPVSHLQLEAGVDEPIGGWLRLFDEMGITTVVDHIGRDAIVVAAARRLLTVLRGREAARAEERQRLFAEIAAANPVGGGIPAMDENASAFETMMSAGYVTPQDEFGIFDRPRFSRYSKMALASSMRVRHRCRFNSSTLHPGPDLDHRKSERRQIVDSR